MFKIPTIFFMMVSAVFAGLYYSEVQSVEKQIVYIEAPVKEKETAPKNTAQQKELLTNKPSPAQSTTRLVFKEVSPFENVNTEDAEILLTIRDYHRRDEGREYKEEHAILFQRLELDEATEEAFLALMADKRFANEIRPQGWMTDEEKEEAEIKRNDVLAILDLKVQNVLGSQFDAYINYTEKAGQYRMIAEMSKKLIKDNLNLNIEQQDQLADVLFNGKRVTSEFDWKEMKTNPKLRDQWLAVNKENQSIMTTQAGQFLEEPQLKIFLQTLKSRYGKFDKQRRSSKNK